MTDEDGVQRRLRNLYARHIEREGVNQATKDHVRALNFRDQFPDTSHSAPSSPALVEKLWQWQKTNPPFPAMCQGHFEDRLLTEFSAERAEQIRLLARPAIGLWPQREFLAPVALATRHGGPVYAPKQWRWPYYEGTPMGFLGQINCADLAGFPGVESLPPDGILAFFADCDVISGCFPEGDGEPCAVFRWPADDLHRTVPPVAMRSDYLFAYGEPTALAFRPFIDLPDTSSRAFDALRLNPDEGERYYRLRRDLCCRDIPPELIYYCDLGSRLLGWPDLVQDELVSQTMSGSRRLIAQLPDRMGPGGYIYFVGAYDVAQRRFERCEMETQHT